ncbi:MAG: amidohydrolase [Bacteroidales bacterium]|nr:amidohydrolase [Bacteroidales bacterium]
MSLLINNARLDGSLVDIVIEDGVYKAIVPHGEALVNKPTVAQVIDAKGLAVYPAMANMHSHAPMTLFRGLGDDQPLDRWLNDYVWPAEQQLTDELVYQGTLCACREMLSTGTSMFNDMYFRLPAMARAVEESGIRARLGLTLFGDAPELDDPTLMEPLAYPTQRVSYSLAPHSIYTVTPNGLRRAAEACEQLHLPMHIHMSETQKEVDDCLSLHGCRPWELLDRLGILDRLGSNIIAAHSLHLSSKEIEMIGAHHITVVHCPCSNLKLGSGYRFAMQELIEAGAQVAIGTDGSASSNNLCMLEATKIATLLQKGWRSDPTACPADQALALATCGHRIAVGEVADLFLVRLNSAPDTPLAAQDSAVSDLVYATPGTATAFTIVGGHVVYQSPNA